MPTQLVSIVLAAAMPVCPALLHPHNQHIRAKQHSSNAVDEHGIDAVDQHGSNTEGGHTGEEQGREEVEETTDGADSHGSKVVGSETEQGGQAQQLCCIGARGKTVGEGENSQQRQQGQHRSSSSSSSSSSSRNALGKTVCENSQERQQGQHSSNSSSRNALDARAAGKQVGGGGHEERISSSRGTQERGDGAALNEVGRVCLVRCGDGASVFD